MIPVDATEEDRICDAAAVALVSLGYTSYRVTVDLAREPNIDVGVLVPSFSISRLYWLLSDQEPQRVEHFIRRYLAMLERGPVSLGTLSIRVELA